jgi:pSer/pThr/pTyr-binding forkhead associated (FHA) protein
VGNWQIRDLHSRNGTFLNGQKLAPDTPTPLVDGDRIRPAGSVEFLFTIELQTREEAYEAFLEMDEFR